MVKYNTKKSSSFSSEKTENLAGGEAFKVPKEFEILSFMATSFMKDTFYSTENKDVERLKEMFNDCKDKEFFAKSAVYVRNEFGMRSVTHLAAVLVAKNVKKEKWTKHFYNAVFRRVDDITETVALYLSWYKKPLPNSLKKGIRIALNKFDDYQIAKYKAEGNSVKLVDVLNLTHPFPTKDNIKSFKKLIEGTLKNTETWEALLSEAGKEEDKVEAKQEVWEKLISEKKLGYFALLRNLNNINKQAPKMLDKALKQLLDKEAIKGSLVLPFRFLTAYKKLQGEDGTNKILSALDTAAEISLDNVPNLKGKTCIFLDQSGSMQGQPLEKASLFAAVICKKLNADIFGFGTRADFIAYNNKDSILTLSEKFSSADQGGTDFKAPFEKIIDSNLKYDRIIILSDMQGWIGYDSPDEVYQKYCKLIKQKPYIYSWDLQGHGTTQLPYEKVMCLAGWSEKVFDLMKFLETDREKMLSTVKSVSFINQ